MGYIMVNEKIDVFTDLLRKDEELLKILLQDHSSKKNIIWATENYKRHGEIYNADNEITVNAVLSKKPLLIKPRVSKSKREQQMRSKNSAEVFTPSWLCNSQINLIDEAWFGYSNVFNIEEDKSWKVNPERIIFPIEKSWQDYISDIRLEISCGEAPYITSRYDTVTGQFIDLFNRIGFLDRKIRVINENVEEDRWLEYVMIAYKSVYAYDWQGDNVFVARENLLLTFVENYFAKFSDIPRKHLLHEISRVISWNIWQMDGLKYVIPNSCKTDIKVDVNLFGEVTKTGHECCGCKKEDVNKHNGVYCKIMDWEKGKKLKFVDALNKGGMR